MRRRRRSLWQWQSGGYHSPLFPIQSAVAISWERFSCFQFPTGFLFLFKVYFVTLWLYIGLSTAGHNQKGEFWTEICPPPFMGHWILILPLAASLPCCLAAEGLIKSVSLLPILGMWRGGGGSRGKTISNISPNFHSWLWCSFLWIVLCILCPSPGLSRKRNTLGEILWSLKSLEVCCLFEWSQNFSHC